MTKPLKSWISSNKKDKIVGFKKILYPTLTEDIKFKVGDFVSWNIEKATLIYLFG